MASNEEKKENKKETADFCYDKAFTTISSNDVLERFKKIREFISEYNLSKKEEGKRAALLERVEKNKDYFLVLNEERQHERLCDKCNGNRLATRYCEICVRKYLEKEKVNWASGSEEIDNMIMDLQKSTLTPSMVIEWIPYECFEKTNNNNRTFWKDGPYNEWNRESGELERCGKREVILKELKGIGNKLEMAKNCLYISSKWGGIVQCYGLTLDTHSNKHMLVMAKMDNNLKSYLEKKGSGLDFLDRLKIIFEVTKALHRIHSEKNFAHGRVNTENVFYLESTNDWHLDLKVVDSVNGRKVDIRGLGLIMFELFFDRQKRTYKEEHEVLRELMNKCNDTNSGINTETIWSRVEVIIGEEFAKQ